MHIIAYTGIVCPYVLWCLFVCPFVCEPGETSYKGHTIPVMQARKPPVFARRCLFVPLSKAECLRQV